MPRKAATKKRRSKVVKSQEIRDTFTSMGLDTRPKLVIAALMQRGIKVSPAQVSNVKGTMIARSGGGSANKGRATASDRFSLDTLVEAKKLADRLGGINAAREALNALARLQ